MKNADATNKNIYIISEDAAKEIIEIILNFLEFFMPITSAERVVSIIFIATWTLVSCTVELTGLTDQSVKSFGNIMRARDTGSLLELKEGKGRKHKNTDVERQILAEWKRKTIQNIRFCLAALSGTGLRCLIWW